MVRRGSRLSQQNHSVMFSDYSPLQGENRLEPVINTGPAPEGSIEEFTGLINHSIRHAEMNNLLLKRRIAMKRFTKIRTLLPILFLLLGTISASAVERPFALNGTGVATLVTDESGNLVGAIPTASGTATHLGQWTVTGTVKYTPDNGVLRSSGEATLTAADGDKLQLQIDGILDPIAAVDQGIFHFVGGTGRFEGVTGDANFVVSLNPLTGGFELTVVGTINY